MIFMRRLLTCLFVVLLFTCVVNAQERKKWEIEPSIGVNYPLVKVDRLYNCAFMRLGLEYRHSIGKLPLWLGVQTSLQSCARKYSGEIGPYQEDSEGFRTIALMGVAEYRFYPGEHVVIFVGSGFGICQRAGYWDGEILGFGATPRVGVQLNGRVRLFVESLLTAKPFNAVSLNFGWAF